MKKLVFEESPGDVFWKNYTELWENSLVRSPFQAPLLLQYFTEINKNIIAVQLIDDHKLKASVVLREFNNTYTFLSDQKTDVNYFIFHNTCEPGIFHFFFSAFFNEIRKRKWKLILNHIPNWAGYIQMMESCGEKSHLFWLKLNYSVCPAIEAGPDKTVAAISRESRQFRHSVNRLKNHYKAEFEILEGDKDLVQWNEDFCRTHVLRWENTSTPSSYKNPVNQQFLLNCMKAWAAQQILVRFTVIAENKRIGFVIGLLEDNRLIHHSTTFHPDYKKYSPGLAVIVSMAEWLTDRKMTILDFGDGDEEYKYILANKEQVTSRIFISPKSELRFILKSKAISAVRENPALYNFYREKIRKFVRP